MNTLDIVSLVFLLFITIVGIWHGFLRSIFRLMAWIAGIVGAYNANNILSHFFRETMGFSEFSTTLVCYAVGFLVPFLVILFIGHILKKTLAETSFGTVDRLLGGVLGFLKGTLVWFALFSILHIMPFGQSLLATRDESFSYSVYKSTLETLGYSSEPIDLVEMAEKKAADIVEKTTDKATEAAKEAAKDLSKEAASAALEETRKALGKGDSAK